MDSTLAQSIAVATHTTMWLAESRAAAAGSQVAPAEGGAPLRIPELVDVLAFDSVVGVEPWAQRLAEDGVDRVWLAVPRLGIAERSDGLPAHIAGAFLGGTPVGLLTTGRAGNQLWHGQLQFGERVVDHAQVVVAHYRSEPVSVGPARLSAGTVAAELDRILARAAAFAEGQQLLDWARRFTDARGRLADGGGGAQDPALLPALWPGPESQRLVAAARAAWVFGGMGSWNDQGFADRTAHNEYERISAELFDAVLSAYVAAVNGDAGINGAAGSPDRGLPNRL